MSDFLKKLYAFPFVAAVYVWLSLSGFFVYPFFLITGFKEAQLRNFIYVQGSVVQLAILFVSVFNKKITKKRLIERPSILVANHPCTYDTFLFSDFGIKNLVCIAKGWPFRIPFYGTYIAKGGYINSDGKTAEQIIEEVRKKLSQGLHIGIFPEGTRRKTTGRFHSLAFEAAIKTKTPVVPFVIKGLEELLPPGSYFPKKADVEYIQLDSVSPKQFEGDAGGLKMARYVKKLIVSQLK
ncbi:lysophospholipid acyltransferase family protein [Endomicrobium proavitum]|uniref:Putative Phospholipid/glycerol acyltransferase n=1 Tax=Endomicrobium proavitum TaxID=1408281 RepID=A0A0G3WI11_9BACT|nr:lysophospholipid acyltransferase family protein [Endomicrobium proavitum]AKL98326.1 putative Phospholipid/glycerol acyltransferase [Endomicrobium proavitum]